LLEEKTKNIDDSFRQYMFPNMDTRDSQTK